MSKKILFADEARQALLRGVETLAKAVGATLGPAGRLVVIEQPNDMLPLTTKDGVTVAQSVYLSDYLENMGARLVRDAAQKTVDVAGDGTTTATVLAHAIYAAGVRAIHEGENPVALQKGIMRAQQAVSLELDKMAIPVKDDMLQHVASISANNDLVLGRLIAEAIQKSGQDGVVAIGDSKDFSTHLDVIEGMQFNSGYIHSDFVSDRGRDETVLENVYILMYEKKLTALSPALNLLNEVRKNQGTLLVISEDVDGDALGTLVLNHVKTTLRSCAVRTPGHPVQKLGVLQDIASLVGGVPISAHMDLKIEQVQFNQLGHADRVVIKKDSTLITGGVSDPSLRIQELKSMILRAQGNELDLLKQRLARLSGGVGVISVGGFTEGEITEKKFRIEDALHAVRCAQEEGVVVGGGMALTRATLRLVPGTDAGWNIVLRACLEPLELIVKNGGGNSAGVLERAILTPESHGYNALTEEYCDLVEAGIIDPVKVVKTALQNAASVAGLMLVTECLICEERNVDAK